MAVLKTFLFYAFVLWLWLWYVPMRLLGQSLATVDGFDIVFVAGVFVFLSGLAITSWCMVEFALRGRGTPAPFDPPRFLVTGALYTRVRNPMYCGFVLMLLGESIVLRSVQVFGLVFAFWTLCHIFVIAYEEPSLRRRFGASYEDYCRAVPRWVPHVAKSSR